MGIRIARLAKLTGTSEERGAQARLKFGVRPVFQRVDTCAAEFVAHTPYLYSTYESAREQSTAARPSSEATAKKKVIILGGGPNRIGQGIEFDYCCVHARARCASSASRP